MEKNEINKKITITIGIPAHNEAKNIYKLLKALNKQNQNEIVIEKIIIINDGSTDETANLVQQFSNVVLINQTRIGKCLSLNKIHELANSDFLVTLDADVLPKGNNFIQDLIEGFKNDLNIGLVGGAVEPINNDTFIELVINFSHQIKFDNMKEVKNSKQVYLCHGRVRAYSKKFYKSLVYPKNVIADDAYSYFYCIQNEFNFYFNQKATVFYTSPKTFKDFAKQNRRFELGKKQLQEYFSKDILKKEYSIDNGEYLQSLKTSLIKNPLFTIVYISMLVLAKWMGDKKSQHYLWEMSQSSKEVKL